MERSTDRRWAISVTLGVAFAALTVLVALDPADPPLLGGIDRWWRDGALEASGWVRTVSEWLKTVGSGLVMVPIRIAVALWLLARRRYAALGAWLLAWVAADLATFALKPWIARVRPDASSATSFPSAHAKTAAQVAVGLALLVSGSARPRALAWVLAAAWIVAMAVSRTVLDEHWLSDVVAGSALGAACALAVWAAAVDRRRPRASGPRGTGLGSRLRRRSPGRGRARGRAR